LGHLTRKKLSPIRALRRAGRAAAAEFFVAPPPPIYVTGAPNAAAAEILSQRRRESAASVEFGTSLLAARRFLSSRLSFSDCPCE